MLIPDYELIPILRSALDRNQHVKFSVNGRSMLPFIRNGDVVELAPMPKTPKLGFVVLAEISGDRFPVHRLVDYCGTEWLLRGDNCRAPDGLVTRENLIGLVVHVERRGHNVNFTFGSGHFISWLSRHGLLFRIYKLYAVIRSVVIIILRLFN